MLLMAVTPTNWNRLKEIVADAIDAPAEERDALIAAACDHDEELSAEAHKLIAAYGDVDGVVLNRDTDGWLGIGGPDVLSLGGQRIGRYRLVRVLGEGAMSAVYLARQANPDRDVAVKLLRTALPLVDARGRFRREATALARLRHPNIAVIYEAGLQDTDDNRAIPFIAMEYVDGVSLTEYAKQHALDRDARIRLIIEVAGAVQHAHQQTIIHRDLKPANVLVDASGTPKVLDFGIARIAAVDSDGATWQTTAGLLLGTPGYMSPEQCAPDGSSGVDVRSDVWSLGVMLYELLLGRLPIEAKGGSIADVMRRLETSEPTPPRAIDPTLRGDLATILMTAVCRDKERRYASAQAFADDLGRYLKELPIEAHPPTTFYLASKFVRRHRGIIAAAAAAALALVASTVVSSAGFYNASRERDRATEALRRSVAAEQRAHASELTAQRDRDLAVTSEKRSQAVRNFLVEMIGSPDPISGRRDVTVLDMLRQNERHLATQFADDPVTAAELFSTVGWTYFNLSEYESAERNLRSSVDLLTRTLGADAIPTLNDRCRLVTILRWAGKPDEARKVCDAALADALRTLGLNHAVTFPLLDNDAGIAEDIGDNPSAIAKYRTLWNAGIATFGPDNDQVLTAGNNLGLSLLNASRYEEAERVMRDVVTRVNKLRGPDSFRALVPQHNLATILLNLERVDEATAIQQRVVANAERSLPPDHDNTRSAVVSLGDMYRCAGRFDEALALIDKAEGMAARHDGPNSPAAMRCWVGRLATLCESGRVEEAISGARAALARCIAAGAGDTKPAWSLRAGLVVALSDAGLGAEAESLGRECIDHLNQNKDAPLQAKLIAACNHAGALASIGRPQDAEREVRDALTRVTPSDGLIEASLRRVLGRALIDQDRLDEARIELDKAWAFVQPLKTPHHRRRVIEQYIRLCERTHDTPNLKVWTNRRAALAIPSTHPAHPSAGSTVVSPTSANPS
jgi:eukaryotic-like serine/threonine-protein kinase